MNLPNVVLAAAIAASASFCSDSHAGNINLMHASQRSAAVRAAFLRANPCPSTGKTSGACPGFIADHAYPLCLGGKDTVDNMRWQTTKDSYIKDRLERAACACRRT